MTLSENVRWYGLVLGLAVVLVVLAVMQYRSSRQLSEATTGQMRANLQGSLMDFRQGLERELAPLCRDLQPSAGVRGQGTLQELAANFDRWRSAAAHSTLVSDVYVWRTADGPQAQLFRLNSERTDFEETEWPTEFQKLRQQLQAMTSEFRGPAAASNEPEPPSGSPHALPSGPHRGQGLMPPPFSWMIDEDIPMLVHSVRETDQRGIAGAPPAMTWILARLNQQVLGSHIFPEIAQRYFGRRDQSSYEIAVLANNAEGAVIYSSDAGFGSQDGVPDAALNLFGRPVPVLRKESSSLERIVSPPGLSPQARRPDNSSGLPPGDEEGPIRIEPIRSIPGQRGWEVIARHRKGSVEAAVAALYHRNLAINFGVLIVLATTIGMIIVASQRARRLAQLQMDFVASVSHELRTPLTGIVSAAQNIADGVISSKERVARYGTAILSQAEQLTELVEQILLFSATQKGRHRYHLHLVDVAEVLGATLKNTSSLIRSSGVTIEQQIPQDLPQVMVDFKALSQCLQNLIVNAVKYGGESRWIGIRAETANEGNRGQEVRITIADKGIGIEPDDLKHIFQPFYRTPEATAAQIHGSGLGLALAKTIAEAMGGSLSVDSVPQRGSAFTVHLPVKDDREAGDHLPVSPEVKSIS
jgi:signal transduction histidine kinase